MRYSGIIWALSLCMILAACKTRKNTVATVDARDSQLQELSSALPDNQVDRTSDGIRVVFNSAILFNVNSSILTDAAKEAIAKLVSAMGKNPGTIQVNGYTDSTGTAEYNVWLSERRATAVKAYMHTLGINAADIQVKGYGAADPVATNSTPEGREKNRRVEVIIASSK